MSDASVIANAKRQAELEALHRDVTKPVPPPGTDGDSLRHIRGMEQISDEMLQERATFNLKEHMAKQGAGAGALDLAKLSTEELEGLANAAAREMQTREERTNDAQHSARPQSATDAQK